jgi:hypothetical protein
VLLAVGGTEKAPEIAKDLRGLCGVMGSLDAGTRSRRHHYIDLAI